MVELTKEETEVIIGSLLFALTPDVSMDISSELSKKILTLVDKLNKDNAVSSEDFFIHDGVFDNPTLVESIRKYFKGKNNE